MPLDTIIYCPDCPWSGTKHEAEPYPSNVPDERHQYRICPDCRETLDIFNDTERDEIGVIG